MNPDKTRVVVDWPIPRNVRDVRAFLGTSSNYRKFIQNYATIASPLNELIRKDINFVWGKDQQTAFDTLKEKLTTSPILSMSQNEGTYVLDVDASDTGCATVLQQYQDEKLKVIAYRSRGFDKCERRYCI